MRRGVIIGFCIWAVLGLLATGAVYQNALRAELLRDQTAGQVRLSEATSRLRKQLDAFRALANFIAQDPGFAGSPDKLQTFALTYGAWRVDLTDGAGRVALSSDPAQVGYRHTAPLIRTARNGSLGYEVTVENDERLARFSREFVQGGVVVVSASLQALEFEWPVIPEPVVLFDAADLSVSSNRPDLLLRRLNGDFPLADARTLAGQQVWSFTQSGFEKTAQVVFADVPVLRMKAMIAIDTGPAQTTAALRASLTAAVVLALGLAGAILLQQRRRLGLESEYSARLETRVQERTAALQQAQAQLVEASNLAALGRLSAGISHELNQPLAAIQTFAENGRTLLGKGRTNDAAGNLGLIADQVRRITRIIGNLRGFARRDATQKDLLDLGPVVQNALAMAAPDIAARGAQVHTDIPDTPVMVMGGQVRLEQVVLNLITNALDAMEGVADRRLSMGLRARGSTGPQGARAVLTVADTGSGIDDPTQVFEPFYTTKDLGSSQGLGMGLALSFGIVSQFGGTLRCRNLDQGAEFTMELPLAEEE